MSQKNRNANDKTARNERRAEKHSLATAMRQAEKRDRFAERHNVA